MSLYHKMIDDIKNPVNADQQWEKIKKKITKQNFKKIPPRLRNPTGNVKKIPPKRISVKREKFKRSLIENKVESFDFADDNYIAIIPKKKVKKMSYSKRRSGREDEFNNHNIRSGQKTDTSNSYSKQDNYIEEKLPFNFKHDFFPSNNNFNDSDRKHKKTSVKKKKNNNRKIRSRKKILRPSRNYVKKEPKDLFFKKMNVQVSNIKKTPIAKKKDFSKWVDMNTNITGKESGKQIIAFTSATDNRIPLGKSKMNTEYIGQSMNRKILGNRKIVKDDNFKAEMIKELEESDVILSKSKHICLNIF